MEYGCTELAVNPSPVSQPQALSLRDGDAWNAVFNTGSTTTSGAKVNKTTAMGYPPFWRGVNLLANGVAGLPLNTYERNGDSKADRQIAIDSPSQKLLTMDANPVTDACVMQEVIQGHALWHGNGFAYIERPDHVTSEALWLLDPQSMIIRFVEGELWYSTVIDGERVRYPGRDILHIRGLGDNGVTGYSAGKLFAEALGVGIAAMEFGSRFFGSGSNQSGILMVPHTFDESKIRNTLAAWNEMATGLTQAHKVALLQEGVKFHPTTIAPDQAQFLETRGYEVRVTVSDILGVPPHMLGDDTRTSHNSLEAEERSFLKYSLGPWLKRWERECMRKLLTEKQRTQRTHYIEFNREADIQMLFGEKIDGIGKQLSMGLASIDEGRALLNQPSIGEHGDKRFVPAQWMELGKEPETRPMPAQDTKPEPTEEQSATLQAMVSSSVTDALAIEGRRVVTAAGKEENFCGWLDQYYEGWLAKAVPGMDSYAAVALKQGHADESKRQLLDVAGSSTPTTLAANVEDLVSGWDERGTTLTADLMGTIE